MADFKSILIANRGEIALRVMRTARRMGYQVVAVYSDADANAPHVRLADKALRIGGPRPADSYLDVDAILSAARDSGAEAVHPGYGFLAENAGFAERVIDAGLVWIGPPPSAMHAMGDKAEAKRLMRAAGVPCVPGYDGDDQSEATLLREAQGIGYPLMIKATAGGGGRGMRLVESAAALPAALASAKSEAEAAFGAATVLLEKAVVEPRHVEIQVFADDHGHVVHLGERDCSVQRRHQKLIEEAPSPAFAGSDGHHLRRRMGEMAVAAARAIKYRGAGTIECLLDARHNFYFMEMNTRLQVEHPVTEALTGLDLVEWQIRVARGEALPITAQEEILTRFESGGHAIEVRLAAEDPARGFLPQSGPVLAWRAGPSAGVRIDHALESGAEVSPFYDSMVAKFIAHGPDRASARARLVGALTDARLLGVRTNQAFLAATLDHPEFAAGRATTGYVGRHAESLLAGLDALPPTLAGLVAYLVRALRHGHDPRAVLLPLAWPALVAVAVDGVAVKAQVQALGGARYRVRADEAEIVYSLIDCAADRMRFDSPAGRVELTLATKGAAIHVGHKAQQFVIEDRSLAAGTAAGGAAAGLVRAPMSGRIVALYVQEGQRVEKGAQLVVLEAMKMEHPAAAPMAATVRKVLVQHGAQVGAGTLLIELEPAA
ncbi:MAG: biotin/lipoyl-binding protein [Burkholderiales bacterium]|nr:biotin/lipoyl-binding protein [Burkholderiales bacterium]